ncbi:unnamed protein product [Coregonus sp. 'balchen']|nr:unnamed protein product [Coregonus sp. 'balchen']
MDHLSPQSSNTRDGSPTTFPDSSRRTSHTGNQVDVGMWRYQRPGFEALLLAELQRQQRCRQFCDTVLRAQGVSVPAHSCILSALSPQLSCALSTLPAPPSGQSHLLDFQAFGACNLVRLVGLLYSREMVGEGEAERQEVISAATRLGIQGLVEVGKRDDKKEREVEDVVQQSRSIAGPSLAEEKRRMEWVSQRDVGVQTDALQSSEAQTERKMGGERRRREKRGGEALTMRFRERMKPTPCEKDSGTQACELKWSETDTGDSNGGFSTGPICSTVDSDLTWGMGLPEGGGLGPGGEGEAEGFERFEGNIAGFISYFLDPAQPQEENLRGRRGRRRRTGGSKRGGTERRARRPRGGGGGARGTVKKKGSEVEQAVMEVSQRTRLWSWGVRACRMGRGGGMVGSKLYLKPRELMQPIKIRLKRRGQSKDWEITGVEEERGGASRRGRKRGRGQQNAGQQLVPEDSAEQFDPLLEDIMMGLDFACGGRQDAGRGVAVAAPSAMDTVTEMTGAGDRSGSAKSSSEVGPQQQHAEGELRDILDHFLRSFEQQVAASNPVAEGQGEGARSTASLSEPYTALRNYSGAQMVTSTAEHRTPSTQCPTHLSSTSYQFATQPRGRGEGDDQKTVARRDQHPTYSQSGR